MADAKIILNGEEYWINLPSNLTDLCEKLQLDPLKVAIEHNREIAPRSLFSQITLSNGDEIEIVHFVGGG
ncbi:thiamine biosynthesis protein ThiS [Sphingorhabdus lutea]|uniref:Thiamine biosynthesis protein ThiS n=1 Tax=Sphingorhabdus lutea TaxID=1913578 RepID=A0A1L3JAT3_9SPHN|nr:thiamine biosynthesis protein ThiS [Sphingorhabdus lutea]